LGPSYRSLLLFGTTMPCNLGYRSVSRIRVDAPRPEVVESQTRAPELDGELLERLGETDPVFAAWLLALDPSPLLEEALARALRAAAPGGEADFRVRDGALVARASATGEGDKADRRALFERVGRRWQVEILRIVAEILDYEMAIESSGPTLILEGEKATSGSVKEYLRILLDDGPSPELRFEHFKSERDLLAEEDRFLALARRLGVRITIRERHRSGQDIPAGAVHKHPNKGRGKA
jgi:hypothetical protein